jgi:hypothetical protein
MLAFSSSRAAASGNTALCVTKSISEAFVLLESHAAFHTRMEPDAEIPALMQQCGGVDDTSFQIMT